MSTITLTDDQKRALIGTKHAVTVTGTVTAFHDHGRLARVSVPGGRHVLVPVADLTAAS